jgi:hypothetical protein
MASPNGNGNNANVSTKDNHAVGDNAFLNNNAAKGETGVHVSVDEQGNIVINVGDLLKNDPGSAEFLGLLDGKSLISDVGDVSFENGYHYADDAAFAGAGYEYDSANQTLTLSKAAAGALGLLDGSHDGFDYVIRMENGTYSTAHVGLTGLPGPDPQDPDPQDPDPQDPDPQDPGPQTTDTSHFPNGGEISYVTFYLKPTENNDYANFVDIHGKPNGDPGSPADSTPDGAYTIQVSFAPQDGMGTDLDNHFDQLYAMVLEKNLVLDMDKDGSLDAGWELLGVGIKTASTEESFYVLDHNPGADPFPSVPGDPANLSMELDVFYNFSDLNFNGWL